jgi:hypothetical protein
MYVVGSILLKQILGYEDVGWIHPTQDRDKFRAILNTVMNLQVQQRRERLDQESVY